MPQSFYARCPECATVFRVTEQLLKVAKGKVRCGACLHIFKATEHLVRPKSPDTLEDNQQDNSQANPQSSTQPTDRETSIARSADRFAEAVQAKDEPDGVTFMSASPSDELEIHRSRKVEEANYPIDQFGRQAQEDEEPIDNELPPDSEPDAAGLESAESDMQDYGSFESQPNDELSARDGLEDSLIESEHDDGSLAEAQEQNNAYKDGSVTEAASSGNEFEPDVATFEPSLEDIEAFTGEQGDTRELDDFELTEPLQAWEAEEESPADSESVDVVETQEPVSAEQQDERLDYVDEATEELASVSVPPLPPESDTESQSQSEDESFEQDVSIDHLNASLKGDALEPDPLDEFDDIVSEKSHTYKWLALAVLLLITLMWGGVTLWKDRQTLAWDDTWGGMVQGMCAVLPCDLQPRRDVAAIELIQRDIGPSEADPDITEFSLVIRNNATFEQPYPVVKIRFTDTRGEVVAEELHPPQSYLSNELAGTQMPPAQKVHILIRAQQSYAGAFGFEFSFQ